MSISPLDRLLNQRGLDDEIGVEISCEGRGTASKTVSALGPNLFTTNTAGMTGAVGKNYKLNLKKGSINKLTCWDGSEAKADGCPINPG